MSNSMNYPDTNYTENHAFSHLVTRVQETESKSKGYAILYIALSVVSLAAVIAYCFSIDPPYISAFAASILIVSGVVLARKDKKKAVQIKKVTHNCGCCNSPLVEETHDAKGFLVCHWCRVYGENQSHKGL